jgi:[glutamine synthetase] adenylyltransferase / [glutamine synthetase]-adenylyl-L-tyrosine phosphorylase
MPQVLYSDPQRAAVNLARIGGRLPGNLRQLLPALLEESPDPDSALNLFERLCESADEDLLHLLDQHPFLAHYAVAVFGHSQYLGETLIRNPDLFQSFVRERILDRSLGQEDFSRRLAHFSTWAPQTAAAELLARFRRREYIRITLRDVLGIAPLAEVTGEISALSDALIEAALEYSTRELSQRNPRKQQGDGDSGWQSQFCAIALGKLGGNELNYSSDVDLLFIVDAQAVQPSDEVSRQEYFIRLAQQLTETLCQPTREGPVFRIDLRLRPRGREGEPAISLAAALRYYRETAQDWELQALIKARHSAGDLELAREFIRGVEPRIYRPGLNFLAVETARASQERISRHRGARRKQLSDVKLDLGGIRDIEFLVQCLQRVYGGDEPWLRSGGTLFSLQKLHDKNHISGKDYHQLTSAYELLRKIEHRLQLRQGQQTHTLPQSPGDLEMLAKSLGSFEGGPPLSAVTVMASLRERMAAVTEIYQRLVHAQQIIEQQDFAAGEFRLAPPAYAESNDQSYGRILHRLAADSPPLHRLASRRDLSSRARRNLYRFFGSALTSSERYAAVLREPQPVETALTVFEASDYLSEILVRHPEEIATIAEVTSRPQPPQTEELLPQSWFPPASAPDTTFQFLAASPARYAEKLALLRRHYRHRTFGSGVADLLTGRKVFESLLVTTAAAETAVAAALEIARASEPGHEASRHLAILALGRLGTFEFDLGSDADLLFVRDSELDHAVATRIAEQVMQILSAYTRDGTIFPVDTRLRPRGSEGELVTTVGQLKQYFSDGGEARAWEALSFTKLRSIAGAPQLGEQASAAVVGGMKRFAASGTLLSEVLAMRAKLTEAESGKLKDNFKTGAGGFYDIDFIAAYLLLRHGRGAQPANIRQRLYLLAEQGLLNDADCATLDYSAEVLRTVDHVIRLVTGRTFKSLPPTEHGRAMTEQLAGRLLQKQFSGGLEPELRRLFASVREVFDRLMV